MPRQPRTLQDNYIYYLLRPASAQLTVDVVGLRSSEWTVTQKLASRGEGKCPPQRVPLHGGDGSEDAREEHVLVDDVEGGHLE